MMGYSKAPTSCACPPLSAPALDHFTHFSTISVAAKPRTATMRNIFVAVGISVRNSIISLPLSWVLGSRAMALKKRFDRISRMAGLAVTRVVNYSPHRG
jgi:hypothetical protein